MKLKFVLIFIVAIATAPEYLAAARSYSSYNYNPSQHPFGVGIILGEPTGFNADLRFQKNLNADFGLTYSFQEYFMIYSDLEWYFTEAFNSVPELEHRLTPYLGGGLGIRFTTKDHRDHDEKTNAFIRIPLGLDWDFRKPRIHIFAELVPGMAFAPKVFALLQGGIGVRYFF